MRKGRVSKPKKSGPRQDKENVDPNPHIFLDDWSKTEDIILVEKVDRLGVDQWPLVSSYLSKRTGGECYYRWKFYIQKEIYACTWNREEDLKLWLFCKNETKVDMKIVSTSLQKTEVQCFARWKVIQNQKFVVPPLEGYVNINNFHYVETDFLPDFIDLWLDEELFEK